MRFYWFDGKGTQGPLEIAELLAQPGFNSESVVCPVGAERSEDWKPAVSYEPLRDAMFKPKPALISAPPPVLPPCPACRRQNPDDALFCSHCGRNLKEAPPQPAAPPPAAAPAVKPPEARPAPAEAQPALAAIPPGPALPKPPEVSAGPKRGPAAGKMGRLGQSPVPAAAPPAAKPPAAARPAPAAGRPAAAPSGRKTLLLAAGGFCAASLLLAGLYLWRRAAPAKSPAVPENLAPPAAAKLGTQEGSPAPAVLAPAPAPVQAAPPPPAAAPAKLKAPARSAPKRARRKAAPPAATPAAEPSDAELGKLLKDKPAPAPAAGEEAPKELMLPGIPKKVRKLPDGAVAPPTAPADPAAGPEQILAERAKEQFNFCHQLLRSGNFGDFFDTCLCADAKNAAPYKGRRRVFIEKASQDPDSEIGSSAEIVEARMAGETAEITAKWAKAEGAVQRTEKWAVEEGLWCLKR